MTSAARRADWIAVGSIGAILTATIAALVFVWGELNEARLALSEEHSAAAENNHLRQDVMALVDLNRLQNVLSRVHGSEANADALFEEFEWALDLLYVRHDVMTKNYATAQASMGAVSTSSALADVIEQGDVLLSNGLTSQTNAAFLDQIQAAIAVIAQHYDVRNRTQSSTLQAQEQALSRLTNIVSILLLVASLICSIAVLLWWSEIRARERRRAAEQEAHFLAYHDPLTRMPNRSQFQMDMNKIVATHANPSMVLVDLDDFKAINDRFGHHAGDTVLCEIAGRLSAVYTAAGGKLARLGGDEFAVILPDGSQTSALLELCHSVLEQCRLPIELPEGTTQTSVSMGVARLSDLDAEEVPTVALTRAADYALYQAKANGRDTLKLYDAKMAEDLSARRMIKDSLPNALANNEFFLMFQPQVELESRKLHGFEALVRWRRNGAVVPPDHFIRIAEETGIITEIDLWVARQALLQVAEWDRTFGLPIHISVNLSAVDFRHASIVSRVAEILAETQFPAHRLTLEMTESVFIEDWKKATQIFEQLAALGVSLSLDDFGTGYSSMSYLRLLDVAEVKIDRSFVTDIENSMQTRMILDALVDMVDSLNMNLVVEGMETRVQADLLRDLGARIGQGYYFGRPMEPADAVQWLVNHGQRFEDPPMQGQRSDVA